MTRVRHRRTAAPGFKSWQIVPRCNRIGSAKRQRVHGEKTPETLAWSSGVSTGAHELSVTLASSGSAFHCGVLGRRRRSTTPTMQTRHQTKRNRARTNYIAGSGGAR
jgi:hypothetical protein